jgi:hypothetical protein
LGRDIDIDALAGKAVYTQHLTRQLTVLQLEKYRPLGFAQHRATQHR